MSSINQLNSSFGKSDIQIINQFIIEEEEEKRKLEYKRERESQEKKPKQILALALLTKTNNEIIDGWS